MKHLYILDQVSAASNYGIGTYIRQIKTLWSKEGNNKLTIAKMGATHNHIEEVYVGNVRYLLLPQENDSYNSYEEYNEALAETFIGCMSPCDINILHVNYFHHYMFIDKIKKIMPNINTIMTIHYFEWGIITGGNISYMKNILAKSKCDYSDKERAIYNYFIGSEYLLQNIDRIICLSKYAWNILHDMYNIDFNKVKYIPNFLPDKACSISKKEQLKKREKWNLDNNNKIILFVGRIERNKGILYLIKAFKELLEIRKDIHLIIVGDGDDNLLKKDSIDIHPYITFTGKIPQEKVYELYEISNIGILPSFYEQCSYVIIEMMMHSLPIIVTDTSGLSEMIENNYGGYKIPLNENFKSKHFIQDLKNTLNDMISLSDRDIQIMGKYNRQKYLETYNLFSIKNKMSNLWSFR